MLPNDASTTAAGGMSGVSERTVGRGSLARVSFWCVGAVLAFLIMLQWGAGTGVHNDFTQNVWLPSRLLLNGANPYNPTGTQVNAALGSYALTFSDFNSGKTYHAIYPVWVSIVFIPFAALPLTLSLALWRAANLLLLLWGLTRMLKVSNPVFRSKSFAAVAAIAVTLLLAVIYRESIVTLYSGQFSVIEFALLAAIWGYLISSSKVEATSLAVVSELSRIGEGVQRRSRVGVSAVPPNFATKTASFIPRSGKSATITEVLLGVALAILATKPQAVGLPVLLLGVWAMSRRRWLVPASAAASLLLLLGLPLLVFPSSIGDWLGVVVRGQASSQAEVSASVWGVSYQWLHTFLPWVPVAIVLTLLGLASLVPSWWRDLSDRHAPVPLALPLTICINSVVSPYLLGYEHVLLLLPAMTFLAAAGLPGEQTDATSKNWRYLIYGWMAVLPFLIVVVQTFIDREYPVMLQSATMLVFCWVANCGLRISRGAPASLFVLRPAHALGAQSSVRNPQQEGGSVGIHA